MNLSCLKRMISTNVFLGLFVVLYIYTCIYILYMLDNIYVKERMVKRDVLRVGGHNKQEVTTKRTAVLNSNFKKPSVNEILRHLPVRPIPTTERTTVLNSTLKEFSVKQVLQHAQVGPIYTTERTTILNSTNTSQKEFDKIVLRQQEELPFSKFRYPLDINFAELIINVSNTGTTDVKPINVYPFTYLKLNESMCKSTENIYLLFMIKSAPGNFDQRQAIRATWANKIFFKLDMIRHVFLLARTTNKTINDRLSEEEEKYSDIVQMTYVDSYYNNTYKTIGGINWCVKYCSQAKFVMMVDDDFYVATDTLLYYLHGLPNSKVRSLFAGYKAVDTPQRRRTDKWYMSLDEYPFEKYPPFISAGAMIMSMDFVKKLQIAIPFTKKFKFDDVFIAIVAHKLGVQPVHLSEIYIKDRIPFYDKRFYTMVASHRYDDTSILQIAWYHHLQALGLKLAEQVKSFQLRFEKKIFR